MRNPTDSSVSMGKRSVSRRGLAFAGVLVAALGWVVVYAATDVRFFEDSFMPAQGTRQFEVYVAANPADPSNLVMGFMDRFPDGTVPIQVCQAAFSASGGRGWELSGPAPLVQKPGRNDPACADPSLAADEAGNFYYAYLNIDFGSPILVDLFVAKSTDGGRTFPTFSIPAANVPGVSRPDKPNIIVDNNVGSPFRGTIYVGYLNFIFGVKNDLRIQSSRDGGQTWSEPVLITPDAGTEEVNSGTSLAVAPDGTVYFFFARWANNVNGSLDILFSKSDDGGVHWTHPQPVATKLPSPGAFFLRNGDPQFGLAANRGLQANSFPSAAVTPDGVLYAAWTDFPQGSCTAFSSGLLECENADARFAVSHDGGRHWSDPAKVSDEGSSPTDQFFPWIAVHPGGLVSFVWLDKRLDSSNQNYDAFYTNTSDGLVFLPNERVTTQTSVTGLKQVIGDYIGMAATSEAAVPAWGDLRSSNVQIFSAYGQLSP